MKRFFCILMSALTFDCLAFDKTLLISDTKSIDYEIPESWSVLKKQVPASSPIQMLKIAGADDLSLEILIFEPKTDSPLRNKPVPEITTLMQSLTCSQYIKGSVEGKDTKVLHQSDLSDGYLSLYTDNASTGFKYVTCVTYVLKNGDVGINLNATLLSKESSGEKYEEAIKAINSFRVRPK